LTASHAVIELQESERTRQEFANIYRSAFGPHDFRGHSIYEFKDNMNRKMMTLAFGFAIMVAMSIPLLRAQDGCDDSPEDPTIVLALVGGAGAFAASVWRAHSRR